MANKRTQAVPNVPIAHRANSNTMSTVKKSALNARLDLHKVKTINPIAVNVWKDKKHPATAAVFAPLVMWALTAVPKASVWPVPLANFKTPKVKPLAVHLVRMEKFPTKKRWGANSHRGVLAKWGNI